MINRDTLALMRPDAILINTCRGPVVDEEAVASALDAHRLWGYGADVFTVEPPPPGHPLIGRDDVIVTPHSAAQTEEGLRTMAVTIATDVVGILRGEPPLNPVNDPEEVEKVRRKLGLAACEVDRGWLLPIGGYYPCYSTIVGFKAIAALATFSSAGSFASTLVRKSTKPGVS